MKRILSMALAICMILSVGISSFADADEGANLKGLDAVLYYKDHLDDENIDAYEKVGTLYREGLNGVTRDYQEAIDWYQQGIDAGKVPSITAMAYMYMHGYGIVRDYDTAWDMLQQAAEQGDGYAMYLIGTLYEYGMYVEKSDEDALSWYHKAADAGYEEGNLKIGPYYIYVADDEEKGLALFNEAAENGFAKAYSYLGDYYYDAEGAAAAKTWYEEGAALGDAQCTEMIGYMYDEGYGVQKSYTQSIEWYEKAAALGDLDAMSHLGFLYYAGMFGNAKPDRAKNYFTEAGARGDVYSLWAIAYRFDAKPATGYDSSKDEVTRVLEIYGKALVCARDMDLHETNAWNPYYGSYWGESKMMEYIDGMVKNHVCTQEQSDSIINEQIKNFRLD